MTFRPWEQYHESSAAAVRLYITVADFNWRDTDYDGPYNGSKGYVPVQAELVGRRAPARCASKHTALLGVCGEWGMPPTLFATPSTLMRTLLINLHLDLTTTTSQPPPSPPLPRTPTAPDGTLEPSWYPFTELQVPADLIADHGAGSVPAHVVLYCDGISADGGATTSTFAILPLSLSSMHDGLVRSGSYELPLYQHSGGGGSNGGSPTGAKCGVVKFNLQVASGELFAATTHALRDFGSPNFSDEQIMRGLSTASHGDDDASASASEGNAGDLKNSGASSGAVADLVFHGLSDPLDIMRLQVPLLNRMHSILSHSWHETGGPDDGDGDGGGGVRGGISRPSRRSLGSSQPPWRPPPPHVVQVQQIQIMYRIVHLMLSDRLYDPHALDNLATRICGEFGIRVHASNPARTRPL